jgi:multicomponent Na+:H+ antiporter subunit G
MREMIGDIVILAGIIFMAIGVVGIYKYKNFYTRMLLTTKIDTVGAVTVIFGVVIKHGLSFFSLKALLLVVIMMVLDPLTSHTVARSAWLCGYQTEDRQGTKQNYSEDSV